MLPTRQALDPVPRLDFNSSMMELGMLLNGKEFKIFKSVIRFDAVSVVNVFSFPKITPNVSSHNNAMLKQEFWTNPNRDISIRSSKPSCVLHFPAAFHRAEFNSTPKSLWLNREFFPAIFTSDCNWHIASPIL